MGSAAAVHESPEAAVVRNPMERGGKRRKSVGGGRGAAWAADKMGAKEDETRRGGREQQPKGAIYRGGTITGQRAEVE